MRWGLDLRQLRRPKNPEEWEQEVRKLKGEKLKNLLGFLKKCISEGGISAYVERQANCTGDPQHSVS